MENKSTGPKTVEGKGVSSKNALRHGATSKEFINDDERDRFEKLIIGLNQHYVSSNPLIKLQLESVARITVQLERVQNTIDASFQKSRTQTNVFRNLASALEMTSYEQDLLIRKFSGLPAIESIDQNEIIQISNEVYQFEGHRPEAQTEILENAPLFCSYLYRKSQVQQLSIEDYIEKEIPEINNQDYLGRIEIA